MIAPPLDGILVADFSRVLAGPAATMWLADLGARVIKVERPGTGDDTRAFGPPWAGSSSAYFEAANRSKESIALDLADEGDAALARRLAARADVVVENFRAGALSRYGLDAASVLAANPRAVYCSITGFGSGAGADLPGYDFLVQAVGGLMSITGESAGPPNKVGVAVVDILTGKDAALGVMAALRHRESTGRGQHVEVNLLSSLLSSLTNQLSGYLATGADPGRMGNQHPSITPYETLRCEDRLLAVAVGNDGQFRRFTEELGLLGTADDPRFATNGARVANREELVALLENVLGARTAADWQQRLQRAGIACGPVNSISGAVEHADSLGLQPLVETAEDALPQVRNPLGLGELPDHAETGPPSPPPLLGEHTDEVRSWLGGGQLHGRQPPTKANRT